MALIQKILTKAAPLRGCGSILTISVIIIKILIKISTIFKQRMLNRKETPDSVTTINIKQTVDIKATKPTEYRRNPKKVVTMNEGTTKHDKKMLKNDTMKLDKKSKADSKLAKKSQKKSEVKCSTMEGSSNKKSKSTGKDQCFKRNSTRVINNNEIREETIKELKKSKSPAVKLTEAKNKSPNDGRIMGTCLDEVQENLKADRSEHSMKNSLKTAEKIKLPTSAEQVICGDSKEFATTENKAQTKTPNRLEIQWKTLGEYKAKRSEKYAEIATSGSARKSYTESIRAARAKAMNQRQSARSLNAQESLRSKDINSTTLNTPNVSTKYDNIMTRSLPAKLVPDEDLKAKYFQSHQDTKWQSLGKSKSLRSIEHKDIMANSSARKSYTKAKRTARAEEINATRSARTLDIKASSLGRTVDFTTLGSTKTVDMMAPRCERTVDILTSNRVTNRLNFDGLQILASKISYNPSPGNTGMEVDIYATPMQHNNKCALLHQLMLQSKFNQLGTTRKPLEYVL